MTDYIDKATIGGTTYDMRDSGARTALETKAEVDGYYEQMTVGNAEQLVATVGVENKAPYNFRTAGGSADIGDRLVEKVVGGTIAWNQLIKSMTGDNWQTSGSTATYSNGVSTFTANAQYGGIENRDSLSIQNGHVYYYGFQFNPTVNNTAIRVNIMASGAGLEVSSYTNTAGKWNDNYTIKKARASNTGRFGIQDRRDSDWDAVSVTNAQCIDITQMFGSTIADYILSLETANEGAGVAWFRKLFPKPYYAYNAGELMSVQAASHKTVGFNAFDKDTMVVEGSYISDSSGEEIENAGASHTDYISVVGGAVYYIKHDASSGNWGAWYDAGKNFVAPLVGKGTKTAPSNAAYMRYTIKNNSSSAGNPDTLCINLSWDGERDGEYEAYVEHVYPLDSSLTLRGIPKLDANNELYYDGDEYESDGTVTRKYGIVDMGLLNWFTGWGGFYTGTINAQTNGYLAGNILTVPYETVPFTTHPNKTIAVIYAGDDYPSNGRIYVKDESYETAEAFQSAMSGVYLVYELATPTTESADPYQNPQIVDDFGTEEYVDAGVTATTPTRDVAIPVGHVSQYQANLRAKLEMAPNSPDGDGDYIVRQTNGQNEYVALTFPADELPAAPTDNGTYTLKCTVSGSSTTYAWVADT